jgi:hypothetical protein
MGFCAYCDYEVIVRNTYSYINEEGDYRTESEENAQIMSGVALSEFIVRLLNDREFSSIVMQDKEISITLFDPVDGTGQQILVNFIEIPAEGR